MIILRSRLNEMEAFADGKSEVSILEARKMTAELVDGYIGMAEQCAELNDRIAKQIGFSPNGEADVQETARYTRDCIRRNVLSGGRGR